MRYTLLIGILFTLLLQPAQAQILDVTPTPQEPANRIDDQSEGRFNPLSVREIPPGGSIQDAWDNAEPNAGIITFPTPRLQTMKIALREGFVTSVILNNDEVLSSVLGDPINFANRTGTLSNLLYVWPKATGYDTTLTIETRSGQVLVFYLRSETFNTTNITNTKVFVGTAGPAISVAPARIDTATAQPPTTNQSPEEIDIAETDANGVPYWTRSSRFDPTKIRQDLVWSGDTSIAPVSAFRDDKFTWLYWGEDSDGQKWPAVWAVEDGIDKPAKTRRTKDGRYLIVETTGPLTLRRGEKTLCIKSQSPQSL